MRVGVICSILVFTSLPAFVNAAIDAANELIIDFTDPNDARSMATWSEPNHITITKEGLGWEGQENASRGFWIQTTELAIGLSWRPARSANVIVQIEPAAQEIILENGKTMRPFAGTMFVRCSPDAKHFSSWQAMQRENTQDKQKEKYEFKTLVQIPEKNRIEYLKYREQYQKLDVPWKSDAEALVKWIIERDPNFFEKSQPFIGYLQFLYERSLYGGQRIQRLHATLNWGVGGLHTPPKNPNVYSNRHSIPWRYRSPDSSGLLMRREPTSKLTKSEYSELVKADGFWGPRGIRKGPLGFRTTDFSKEFWESDKNKMDGYVSDYLAYDDITEMIIIRCHLHVPIGDYLENFIKARIDGSKKFYVGSLSPDFLEPRPYLTAVFKVRAGEYGLLTAYEKMTIVELQSRYGVILEEKAAGDLKEDGVTAKIDLGNTNIRFKKDFSVPIIIENHTGKPVQIDTSPDEVIEYPSEKSGGEYRVRGSRCEIIVEQQDSDGKLGFFSTTDRKVKAQNKSRNSFTIKPGKTHTLEFRISPWGPTYSAIPSTAAPGPAVIKAKLKILIDGQQMNIPL